MSDSDPAVICEKHGGLTVLRLNQPQRMNALSDDIKTCLAREVPAFMRDPAGRCLLITGSGDAFCAGGDMSKMAGDYPVLEMKERLERSHESWVSALLEGQKPVVMAVNGPAAGAGFGLAMLGDLIVASESAYFLAGFATVGLAADMGLCATLPRAIGMPRAKEILFMNRKVSAREALAMGMINSVTSPEDLMRTALDLGTRLASAATVGIGLTKMLLHTSYEQSLTTLLHTEAVAQAVAFTTTDRKEGVAAFVARRKPHFVGR